MTSTTAGRILLEVLRSGPSSRSELARRLDLSTPTLTRLSKPLVSRGLLRETTAEGPARAGRPSRPLEIVPDAARFVGVKISRDGLDGVVSNLGGRVLAQRWVPLRGVELTAVVTTVVGLVERLTTDEPGVVQVGVAVGGRVVEGRVVSAVSGFRWDDLDLWSPLQARVSVPVRVLNDVQAYLLAEQWLGAGRGSDAFMVLTVGVGVGCAYAADGRILTGADGTAGLIGHWPLTATGPVCPDGHVGCASGWLAIDRVLARVAAVLGRDVALDEAVELATVEPEIAAVFRAAGTQVGRLAGLVANVLGPSRIVLGGDAISYVRFAEAETVAGLRAVRHPYVIDEDVVINPETGFGDWARGAAVAAMIDWVERVAGSPD